MSPSVRPNGIDVNFRTLKASNTYRVEGLCKRGGDTFGQGITWCAVHYLLRDLHHLTQHGRTIIGPEGNGVERKRHPSIYAVSHL